MLSNYKNGGSINFVKGETINLQTNLNSDKNNAIKQQKDLIKNCDNTNGNTKVKYYFY